MYKYFQGDVTYWLGPQKLFLDSETEKKFVSVIWKSFKNAVIW